MQMTRVLTEANKPCSLKIPVGSGARVAVMRMVARAKNDSMTFLDGGWLCQAIGSTVSAPRPAAGA
jgi:hypothetical protein